MIVHFCRSDRAVCKATPFSSESRLTRHIPEVNCVWCLTNLTFWLRELEAALSLGASDGG